LHFVLCYSLLSLFSRIPAVFFLFRGHQDHLT